MNSLRLIVAIVALALPAAALAAGPSTAPAAVVVVYPIADLIESVPDFPDTAAMQPPTGDRPDYGRYGGGGGGGAGGVGLFAGQSNANVPNTEGPTRTELVDNLIALLRDTVDSESWTDNGGTVGQIKERGGRLIVEQTPANQARVLAVLRGLRTEAPTVQVEAVWATVAAADLAAARDGGTLDELVAKLDPATPRGEMACRDGEVVYLASGPAINVVSDLTPVVGQNALGFDPTMLLVQTGGCLRFRPVLRTIAAGEPAAAAVFTVESVLSRFDAPPEQLPRPMVVTVPSTKPADAVYANPVGDLPGGIDRWKTSVARLATSIVVPVGQWAVVGGMTPDAGADQPGGTQVYLMVRITVPKSVPK